MATEQEIRDNYLAQHDTLSAGYYAGTSGLTKEEFDLQHGQIWNNLEIELIAEGYLVKPEPPRDLEAELDALKVKVAQLEKL